ncbi:MAG TPA: hypothetical protein VLL98_02680 [Rickettsiales bacterium]|nr:hypothetical protein [Rickettsiales bacterium]
MNKIDSIFNIIKFEKLKKSVKNTTCYNFLNGTKNLKCFLTNGENFYYKKFDNIELNNSINNRYLFFKFLKNKIKSKIKNFYLFYINNELDCIVEVSNLQDDFELININDSEAKNIINDYLLYKKAKSTAQQYHNNQIYGGFLPYMFHLNKVDSVIDHFFYLFPQDKLFVLKTSAILHDIIEDTNYSVEKLENDFGSEIKDIVVNLTKKNKCFFLKESYNHYYNRVAKNLLSAYVKIADKIINTKQTLKDKRTRHIKNIINGHEPFKRIVYDKTDSNEMTLFLDLLMAKLEKIK